MDLKTQKSLMHEAFMYMMVNGTLKKRMVTTLKPDVFFLEKLGDISISEKDDRLPYFFQEHSQGCSFPLSESYIRSSMIPVVYQHGKVNLAFRIFNCHRY